MKILKTIPYSELAMWDVKRYNHLFDYSFENAILLRDILKPIKESISKEELIKNDWRIINKINFQGKLFLRDKSDIEKYKGNVFKVPGNSIIYSKINVRHGCIYYHEKDKTAFAVSSEYPVFIFDIKKINGYYLILVLRSNEFKKLLATKTSGISKARVKVDEFLETKIPLPPLEEQNRIVATYNAKIDLAKQQEEKATILENELKHFVDNELGIIAEQNTNFKKTGLLKYVNFKSLHKWGTDALLKVRVRYKNNFIIKEISKICDVGSGGTPSRSNKNYYNGDIPWVKTGEVVNDIIYDTEEKITKNAIKNSSARLYEKDSLIVAMYGQGKTRGRTAKLGIKATTNQACAVLHNFKNEDILIDYLWVYLMNEYDRLRELASGNNQPNLNAQMIKEYPVVIPPKDIQEKITNKFFKLKQQIKDLQQRAKENRELAIKKIENEIFKME
ncbi:restriction endonuclease subunit S [bacterium]|nr:restriction endonuclease subunit S [bacterium]